MMTVKESKKDDQVDVGGGKKKRKRRWKKEKIMEAVRMVMEKEKKGWV